MKNFLSICLCWWLISSLSAQTNCITVDACPADLQTECDLSTNDPMFWNASYWVDTLHLLSDLPEKEVALQIIAESTCGGALSAEFQLFLDLDQDGIQETLVASADLPDFNTVLFNNTVVPGGELRTFDQRNVGTDQQYGFALDTISNGTMLTARVRWNTQADPNTFIDPQLPVGRHKIVWIIRNDLGEETSCTYEFEVKDCQTPTVICVNGMNLNIHANGTNTNYVVDYILTVNDNITPGDQLAVGIRRSGTGTGFPFWPDGTPQNSVTFDCADVNTQQWVEIWCLDKSGNMAFCETLNMINDNQNYCPPTSDDYIHLKIRKWCDESEINGFYFNFNSNTTIPTSSSSWPDFPLDSSTSYSLLPSIPNTDPLNGIEVMDLVLISQHILNYQLLTSPYAIIAADANGSNSVTAADVVELKKLILGIYTQFPNNFDYIFVDANYVFPNPQNPFFTQFPFDNPFQYLGSELDSGTVITHYAIKTGDVNCSGTPDFNGDIPSDDRNDHTVWLMEDAILRAGEQRDITLTPAQAEAYLGLQLSIDFDPELLEVVSTTGHLPHGFDDHAFAIPEPGRLNILWFHTSALDCKPNEPAITIKVRAKQDLRLSNHWKQAPKPAFAVDEAVQSSPMTLMFKSSSPDQAVYAVQASPNPTQGDTRMQVWTAEAGELNLSLYNPAGQLVYQEFHPAQAGMNIIYLPGAYLPQRGLYLWQISGAGVEETGKLLRH